MLAAPCSRYPRTENHEGGWGALRSPDLVRGGRVSSATSVPQWVGSGHSARPLSRPLANKKGPPIARRALFVSRRAWLLGRLAGAAGHGVRACGAAGRGAARRAAGRRWDRRARSALGRRRLAIARGLPLLLDAQVVLDVVDAADLFGQLFGPALVVPGLDGAGQGHLA